MITYDPLAGTIVWFDVDPPIVARYHMGERVSPTRITKGVPKFGGDQTRRQKQFYMVDHQICL